MTQKKAKPIDPKGKSKSEKSTPQKPAVAKTAAKGAAKSASPAKGVMTKAAPAAAVKKSPTLNVATIKKPSPSAKPVASAAAKTQAATKNSVTKADMTKTAAKKAEPAKASVKPVLAPAKPQFKAAPPLKAAPPVTATMPAKPIAPVKAVVPVKAAASIAKPVVATVKAPAAPAKAAAPAGLAPKVVPVVARPIAVAPGVKPATAIGVRPAAPVAKAPIAAPVAATAPSEPKKPVSARHGFKTGEWIVYPAQGVGRIVAIEEQEIAGMKLELFVITFEKDKMTLRVPTGKAATVGMRKLAEEGIVKRAMETLKGKARIKRTMWSRRAQEFEAKINSGDLVSVAEVVRDLYRAESQPEQSYSERLLFERALDRMAREIAAVDKLDERGAAQRIVEVLSKSAKARRPVTEEAPAASDDDGDEATAAA